MLLLYLKDQGFTDLYAHDLPGVQHDVMEAVMTANGVKQWDGGKVGTVLCFNMLEHVANPVEVLSMFYSIGDRVIANADMDRDEKSHVAPVEELKKCRRMLEEREGLYRAA